MKAVSRVFLSLTLVFAGVVAPAYGQSGVNGAGVRVRAFAKANEALTKAHLVMSGVVVISERRGYIVVSYVDPDPGVRGGSAHVVYDPRTDKVVHILGED
jgi:hypothetical protein